MVKRTIRQLHPTLDSFDFWTAVAYFGVVAVVIGLYFVNENTQNALARQARDEGAHSAEIVANARSQFNQCVSSIPTLRKIDAFIDGQRITAAALVANNAAAVKATSPSDPLYPLRVKNLQRLLRAEHSAAVVRFPIPTRRDCLKLRRTLLKQR